MQYLVYPLELVNQQRSHVSRMVQLTLHHQGVNILGGAHLLLGT